MRLALVMHSPMGAAFYDCALHILGDKPNIQVFDVLPDANTLDAANDILNWLKQYNTKDPVLILCDIYGATPFNIAKQAYTTAQNLGYKINLLTGANISMLLKALTQPVKDIDTFIELVYQSAQRGIVITGEKQGH